MDYLIFKFLAPIVTGFNILSMSVSFQFRRTAISKIILCFQISVIVYICLNYLEFMSNDINNMVFIAKLEHFPLQLVSFFWFLFALHYTGYSIIFKKYLYIIVGCLIVINMSIIFTNDFHRLFYISTDLIIKGNTSEIMAVYGIYFWIVTGFDYVFIIAGSILIIICYFSKDSLHQKQALFILIGFIVPLFVNIIYIFRVIPGFDKDFSSLSFAISSMFIFIGINRFKLLHYSPISRSLVLQNIKDGIITLDNNFRLVDFNAKAQELFGLNENDIGKLYPTLKLKEIIDSIFNTIDEKEEISYMKLIANKSYNLTIKKLSKLGKSAGIVLTLSDVTDKLRLIDELEESHKEINNLQEGIMKSEKLAALGQLSAEVSHEINNPLTYIKSNFSVMERYLKGEDIINRVPEMLEIIDETKDGILRISEVVQNMLSYSRDESLSEVKMYNINKGIERTLVISRSLTKYKATIGLTLGDIPSISYSQNNLDQVLLNLIINASQSIEDNRTDGLISIKTFVENSNIICEVSDNGAVINYNDKDLIFEPFYTTKKDDYGTGLGLSLSKKIVEKYYNGNLYLKDAENKIFRLEIPITK